MSDRPEDVDAAFAAIVADLEREGLGASVEPDTEPTEELPHPAAPAPTSTVEEPAVSWRGHDAEWDWSWGTDEEHYVPPDPPPLPRLRPMTVVALILVIVGLVLLIAPNVIGLDARIGTPISLLALVCGFGLLFLRIRRAPPDSEHDNGAQI